MEGNVNVLFFLIQACHIEYKKREKHEKITQIECLMKELNELMTKDGNVDWTFVLFLHIFWKEKKKKIKCLLCPLLSFEGLGFLTPVIGFYCQKCEEFIGDLGSAENHASVHQEKNPSGVSSSASICSLSSSSKF